VDRFELRNDDLPQTNPRQRLVVVCGIIVIPEVSLVAVSPGVRASEREERSDYFAALLWNSGKPGKPRPSGQVEENGLQVVVLGVGGGDEVRASLKGDLTKKGVPSLAPCLLNTDSAIFDDLGNVRLAYDNRNVTLRTEVLTPARLVVCLRSLTMVEVGGDTVMPNLRKEMQEACRISAATVADQDRRIGRDES